MPTQTATIRHRRLPGLFAYPFKLEAIVHEGGRPRVIAASGVLWRGQEREGRAALERRLLRDGWEPAGRDANGHRRFQREVR